MMDATHFLDQGNVEDTLESCDRLELLLARLRRKHVISEQEAVVGRESIDHVRALLERRARGDAAGMQSPGR